MREIATVLFLVTLATAVATFARRWRLPAPSLLVVAGLIVGLLPGIPEANASPEIIGLVVLPPLIYVAAEELSLRDLRTVWRPVTILAIGLVLTSAAAVGVVAVAVTSLTASMAFVLGAILASTDPVAVSALGRRLPLPPRLNALVQAESLFNDASSLVLFKVAVGLAVVGGAVSWGHTSAQFLLLAGGGTLAGVLVAFLVAMIRSRTEDPVLETVIYLLTPYLAYVAAESMHASGVMAVVVAGLLLGGKAATKLTNAQIRLQLHAVSATVVFLLESVVFSLIGLQLPSLVDDLHVPVRQYALPILAVTGTMLAIRMLWVYPLYWAMQHRRGQSRPSWKVPVIVTWAGARGVLPLAAALSIPLTTEAGTALPQRELVLFLTVAVIVLTLVVQGFTLEPLVKRTGIGLPPRHAKDEEATARLRMATAALVHLEQVADLEAAPDAVIDRLRRGLQTRIDSARIGTDDGAEPVGADLRAYQEVKRDLINAEGNELLRLYETGVIADSTRRRLQHGLDLQNVSLD